MGWGQWGRREEQREDRRGVKRGRRECQGIMVCSEAFKNGDDVTQKWFAFLRPTPPFPGPLESLLLPMGVFFFFNPQTPPMHWIPRPGSCCGVQGAACKGEWGYPSADLIQLQKLEPGGDAVIIDFSGTLRNLGRGTWISTGQGLKF